MPAFDEYTIETSAVSPKTASLSSPQRFPQLTFTRFVAAFLVVVFHYGTDPRPVLPFVWFKDTTFFTQAGSVAVHYFFVLSGFVMMTAYRNRTVHTGVFIRNRLIRIYPAYFAAIVLAVLIRIVPDHAFATFFANLNWLTTKHLIRDGWHSFQRLDKPSLWLNISLQQAWSRATCQTYNGPGWSLSVEFFFYLLFPFLLRFTRFDRPRRIVGWLVALVVAEVGIVALLNTSLLETSRGFFQYASPLLSLPSFLIGMLTCEIGLRQQYRVILQPWLPLATAITSLVGVVVLLAFVQPVNGMLLAPVFGVMVWGIAYDTSVFSRLMSLPGLVLLGELSYGIYIFQSPVCSAIDMWTPIFDYSPNATVTFYVFLTILTAIAWVSYHWLEMPVQRWAKQRWREVPANKKPNTVPVLGFVEESTTV